jgi:hypothetical protein
MQSQTYVIAEERPGGRVSKDARRSGSTVEDALKGARPRIPVIDTGTAFRRAGRETNTKTLQTLDL